MKFPRSLGFLALALLVAGPLAAQTSPAAPAVKQLPVAKVAWLDSRAFASEEGGIKRLVRSIKELELEFSGTESELNLLSEKLRTIVGELRKLQEGGEAAAQANGQAIQDKRTEGMKIQQELQAKQQAAQQAVQQAQQAKQGPISVDIGKALEVFAKERGIGVLVDAGKLGDGLLYTQPEIDVTKDFVDYFNAQYP
jgi:Skp family chaperone for outer membrane proteins